MRVKTVSMTVGGYGQVTLWVTRQNMETHEMKVRPHHSIHPSVWPIFYKRGKQMQELIMRRSNAE